MGHGLPRQGSLEVRVETFIYPIFWAIKWGGDASFSQSLAPKTPKSNAIYLVSGLLSAGLRGGRGHVDSNLSPHS